MPPTNKAWLISSAAELAADARATSQCSLGWLRTFPFPGVDAGIDDKCKWLSNIHNCYEAELEDSFYMASAPGASEVVTKTLMAMAPDNIDLQINIPRAELENINITKEQGSFFAANLQDFSVPGYDGEADFNAYKKWILSNQKDDQIIFAVLPCNKHDKVSDKSRAFVDACGLREHYHTITLVDYQALHQACYEWGFQKLVGENMYYKKGSNFVVPILMSLNSKSEIRINEAAFKKQALAAEKSTKTTPNPQAFFYVSKKGKGEGNGATADNTHVVWVPEIFTSHSERVSNHLNWGEGEAHCIQKRLEKGNTDTGNLKVEIFQAELKYAKSMKLSLKEQFCATLALTLAAGSDTFWMNDTELSDDLAKSIKALGTVWRTSLLTKTDEELGIVAPAANPGTTSSRDGLYEILGIMGQQFKEVSEYVKVGRFNFKPNLAGNASQQPKKKKRRGGTYKFLPPAALKR